MKRFICAALVVIVVAVLFAGCGSSVDPTGKYVVEKIGDTPVAEYIEGMISGYGISLDDFLSMSGLEAAEDFASFDIKSDGTAVAVIGGEDAMEGTWKLNGDKLSVTLDGDTADLTFDGDHLYYKMDGMDYTFIKK